MVAFSINMYALFHNKYHSYVRNYDNLG